MKTAREKVADAQRHMAPDVVALHAQAMGAALEEADATCRKLIDALRTRNVMVRRIQSLHASLRKREARELLAHLAEIAELDDFNIPDVDMVLSARPGAHHG